MKVHKGLSVKIIIFLTFLGGSSALAATTFYGKGGFPSSIKTCNQMEQYANTQVNWNKKIRFTDFSNASVGYNLLGNAGVTGCIIDRGGYAILTSPKGTQVCSATLLHSGGYWTTRLSECRWRN